MLVTERPGRLRVIRNGVLDPTPIGPLPAMLATQPRRPARRLAASALRGEPSDLPHLLEAGPRRTRSARRRRSIARDGMAARRSTDVKDILVADAYHGGPGTAGHRPGKRQLRLATRVGQERPAVRHARRSQLSARRRRTRLAHRQDPADQRRRQRAAGQSVRRQARIQAGDLHARTSQSARTRVQSA